ncbi:4'-phosphopantetheinyl transferase family protein [Neisseria sp. CCUG12390]|uniref:4'-phosphopantetheinyl transferase family protein n=1 Tax=Neisseria sp. CCUG12390 TaxID=3392035 RepID=UPI003A102B2E
MTRHLDCLLAAPPLAEHYSDGLLDETDNIRLQQSPHLSQRLDWQVSRALKFQTASITQSLSHSHGYAALLTADTPSAIGVDIEKIKPRDFQGLAAWICSEEEQNYLSALDWQAEDFYRLWCTKEALIKAAGLNFPADMARVGYAFRQDRISGLCVEGKSGWHGTSALLNHEFAVACVWQGNQQAKMDWLFYGGLSSENLTKQKAV